MLERYIGLPYCPRRLDCADLLALVQREMFGREVLLPGKRARPLDPEGQAKQIAAYLNPVATPTDSPKDGDAVLMREDGRAGHIGVFFFVNYSPHVLHTSARLGGSVLHRIQDLSAMGLQVEGYYTWTISPPLTDDPQS